MVRFTLVHVQRVKRGSSQGLVRVVRQSTSQFSVCLSVKWWPVVIRGVWHKGVVGLCGGHCCQPTPHIPWEIVWGTT